MVTISSAIKLEKLKSSCTTIIVKHNVNKQNGVSEEFGMNCEMAADEPMLNDIMGDHGLLSGSETVKSTGMSDEDQSKFWSQVQKAE